MLTVHAPISTQDPLGGVRPGPARPGVVTIAKEALRRLVLAALAMLLTFVVLPAVLVAAGP